ncbi:MAG: response regulator [Tannerellaceae bacterium]|nr:response regulator [Tannerellaceae bacterium]
MIQGKIIIVDDNTGLLHSLRLMLSRRFKRVVTLTDPTALPALLSAKDTDIVLLDMNFVTGKQAGEEGLFWLECILGQDTPPEVLLMTAYAKIDLAVEALKKGASDFIVKPWENEKLLDALQAAMVRRQHKYVKQEPTPVCNPQKSETLEEMEKQFIKKVLIENKWNLSLAANQLDITRQTLYNKIRKYNL